MSEPGPMPMPTIAPFTPHSAIGIPTIQALDPNAALQYGALGVLLLVLMAGLGIIAYVAKRLGKSADNIAIRIDEGGKRIDRLLEHLSGNDIIAERRHGETRLSFEAALKDTRHSLRDDIQTTYGSLALDIRQLKDDLTKSMENVAEARILKAIEVAAAKAAEVVQKNMQSAMINKNGE